MKVAVSLNEMKRGQTGLVSSIQGGFGFVRRIESMNIRVGKKVTKLSSFLRKGPVTIRIDCSQLALGYGMASKIFVEVEDR